jgi:hypothetical protein
MVARAVRAVSSVSARVWRVFLGGDDAAVSEAFLDGVQVGAAGEELGGVGVAQVVGADADADAGGVEGGFPDVFAEPGAGDVAVGGDGAGGAGVVFAVGPALGAVAGVGAAAVLAFAAAAGVAADGAVRYCRAVEFGGVRPRSTSSCTGCSWDDRARQTADPRRGRVRATSGDPPPVEGSPSMSVFSAAQLAYLGERRLARIATVGADGTLHVTPVGM